MAGEVKNYIAGKWINAESGKNFASFNPADIRETVATVALSGKKMLIWRYPPPGKLSAIGVLCLLQKGEKYFSGQASC